MALFNIFKKKKPEAKRQETRDKKQETRTEKPKAEAKKEVKILKKERKGGIEAYRILKSPHITEKATDLAQINQYVFRVWPRANKPEIKKAIEGLYGVDVLDVKIINIPRKMRRLGRISGWRKKYKKAIIKIKEGQKIEVLSR